MKIYPAVDIKDGKCVRLKKGVAEDKTIYFENPVDAAKSFVDAGSKNIHVVDLDGAFGGRMFNLKTIEQIASLGLFVELGGGMREILENGHPLGRIIGNFLQTPRGSLESLDTLQEHRIFNA